MNKNINRIIRELENDPAIQAMHRENIEKRQALRERRRALMLARLHGRRHNVIAIIDQGDDRKIKKEAIKQAIYEKYNGDTVKALLGYIPHLVANGLAGKFNQDFDNLFHEAVNEVFKEQLEKRKRIQREEEARRQENREEEKEVYILSNGEKTANFLEWAQDRIDARKAAAK